MLFKKVILGRFPGEWRSQTMLKYFSVKYLHIWKKTGTLAWAIPKIDFWVLQDGGTPKLFQNISLLSTYTDIKKQVP